MPRCSLVWAGWSVVCLGSPFVIGADGAAPSFIRGDANGDANHSVGDAMHILGYLFGTGNAACLDSLDSNDDGGIDIADPIYFLHFLFGAGHLLPFPGEKCGEDPTGDGLGCELYLPCGTPRRFRNSTDMELVYIPPGSFLMGSPADERGRNPPSCGTADELQHTVSLSCGFYISTTEVTYRDYRKLMPGEPRANFNPLFACDDCPVAGVSWFNAREFCRELSAKESLDYRLPTEAEWEYSCRAGSTTRYWFGEALDCPDSCLQCPQYFDYVVCGRSQNLRTVKQKIPNEWGIYDMHDTLLEWCSDWFGPYPRLDRVVHDPVGPPSGTQRVVRGNAFTDLRYARSAARGCQDPGTPGGLISFRVVLRPPCSTGYRP